MTGNHPKSTARDALPWRSSVPQDWRPRTPRKVGSLEHCHIELWICPCPFLLLGHPKYKLRSMTIRKRALSQEPTWCTINVLGFGLVNFLLLKETKHTNGVSQDNQLPAYDPPFLQSVSTSTYWKRLLDHSHTVKIPYACKP